MIASYKNKIIAGAVFFHFGGRAIYKYGGSDDEYQHLRANNLVMWRAIQWYAENGHTVLSFGRTDPGNEGLIRYKCGWGTEQTTIIYYKYDLRYNSFVKAKCLLEGYHNIVFSSMPNALSRGFGSLLYKHIG